MTGNQIEIHIIIYFRTNMSLTGLLIHRDKPGHLQIVRNTPCSYRYVYNVIEKFRDDGITISDTIWQRKAQDRVVWRQHAEAFAQPRDTTAA